MGSSNFHQVELDLLLEVLLLPVLNLRVATIHESFENTSGGAGIHHLLEEFSVYCDIIINHIHAGFVVLLSD
jgi:hypothetical protein